MQFHAVYNKGRRSLVIPEPIKEQDESAESAAERRSQKMTGCEVPQHQKEEGSQPFPFGHEVEYDRSPVLVGRDELKENTPFEHQHAAPSAEPESHFNACEPEQRSHAEVSGGAPECELREKDDSPHESSAEPHDVEEERMEAKVDSASSQAPESELRKPSDGVHENEISTSDRQESEVAKLNEVIERLKCELSDKAVVAEKNQSQLENELVEARARIEELTADRERRDSERPGADSKKNEVEGLKFALKQRECVLLNAQGELGRLKGEYSQRVKELENEHRDLITELEKCLEQVRLGEEAAVVERSRFEKLVNDQVKARETEEARWHSERQTLERKLSDTVSRLAVAESFALRNATDNELQLQQKINECFGIIKWQDFEIQQLKNQILAQPLE